MAGVVAIAILILSGAIRERFQRAIDRRFSREKYKFDEAMQQMNLAVGRLVDRGTLGRRLLEAAADTLRLEWGAIYLADDPAGRSSSRPGTGPSPTSGAWPRPTRWSPGSAKSGPSGPRMPTPSPSSATRPPTP